MDSNTEKCTVKIEQINDRDYGKCIRETWTNKKGLIHRDDDHPAVILRHSEDEEPFQREWCQNGMLDRKGAPARIYDYGFAKKEEWFENGLAHRDGGPAMTVKFSNGIIAIEEWLKYGQKNRKDGPADIERHEDTGITISERWFLKGKAHREKYPAYTKRDGYSGAILNTEFYENGVRLNINTPNMEPVM